MELKNTIHNERVRLNVLSILQNTIPVLFSSCTDTNNNLFITEVKVIRGQHIKDSFYVEASYITDSNIKTCRIPVMQANLAFEHTELGKKKCYAKILDIKNLTNSDVDINVLKATIKHAETFSVAALSTELNILSTTDENIANYPELLPDHFLKELGYTKNSSKYIQPINQNGCFAMTKQLPINDKIKEEFKIF